MEAKGLLKEITVYLLLCALCGIKKHRMPLLLDFSSQTTYTELCNTHKDRLQKHSPVNFNIRPHLQSMIVHDVSQQTLYIHKQLPSLNDPSVPELYIITHLKYISAIL